MSTKIANTFWYRHGVKLVVAVLLALTYLVYGMAGDMDSTTTVRDSKIGFLEFRCDRQAEEIMLLKRRVLELEEAIKAIHGIQRPAAWD